MPGDGSRLPGPDGRKKTDKNYRALNMGARMAVTMEPIKAWSGSWLDLNAKCRSEVWRN